MSGFQFNHGASFNTAYLAPTSPVTGSPSCAPQTPNSTNALVLFNPTSLYGLYYNEHIHGPFATGHQVNPFTPGLSPVSDVPKPTYAVDDPLRERYPAARSANDPLNWITEDLFNIGEERANITQQRLPIRSSSLVSR